MTGINFYNKASGNFTFRKGSLFANIILGDEINRATPRTQSGLLESMEEKQITVDGTTYKLPIPYFVIATQNPIETQGTYPLPEAQLDRFLLLLNLGYLEKEETIMVLRSLVSAHKNESTKLSQVCDETAFIKMQEAVKTVFVHDDILGYIVDLAVGTRNHESVSLGISTRGIFALTKIAQSYAALCGRGFVSPKDIVLLMPYVFAHRLRLKGGIGNRKALVSAILNDIITSTVAPTENWRM